MWLSWGHEEGSETEAERAEGEAERFRRETCLHATSSLPGHLSRGTQASAIVNRTTVNTGVGVFSSVAHRFTPWNITQPVAATRMIHRVSCQVKSVGWGKTNTVWLPLYVEGLKTKHTDTDSDTENKLRVAGGEGRGRTTGHEGEGDREGPASVRKETSQGRKVQPRGCSQQRRNDVVTDGGCLYRGDHAIRYINIKLS